VAACAGVVVVWTWLAGDTAPLPRPPDAEDARANCAAYLKRAAHDPASFEAVDRPRWRAVPVPDEIGHWRVDATFRASNGFGAIRVVSARCLLDVSGSTWRLVDISMR